MYAYIHRAALIIYVTVLFFLKYASGVRLHKTVVWSKLFFSECWLIVIYVGQRITENDFSVELLLLMRQCVVVVILSQYENHLG